MKQSMPIRFTAILALVALYGCGSSGTMGPGSSSSPEQAAVATVLADTPELIDDGQLESADVGLVAAGPAVDGPVAAIQPYRFWRNIDSVDRRFEYAFTDSDSTGRPTVAVVTVHKVLRGTFNIVAGAPGEDPEAVDSTRHVVRKPLVDHWVRRLRLVRIPRPDSLGAGERSMWKVAATSGVKVTSARPATEPEHVRIESIRVQSGTLDTTLTAPLEFFRLRRILKLESGAEVTLTVRTTNANDIVLLMARGRRMRLEPNGDNTYTGRWIAPDDRGIRHFGVNALAHDTLWDDAAVYNSQAWVFPYAVVAEEIADYRP